MRGQNRAKDAIAWRQRYHRYQLLETGPQRCPKTCRIEFRAMSVPGHNQIPMLGFGTFQLEGQTVVDMVSHALRVGYRHIDTAQVYGNEPEVGQAIRSSGLPRAHVVVTTKVWPDNFSAQQMLPSVDESLQKLQMEYVDLLLLHWPKFNDAPLEEALEGLMAAQDAGKTRLIGISNFTCALMQRAVEICGPGRIVTNQVEYHPYLSQAKVIEMGRSLDMTITAYRPLAKGHILQDRVIQGIANNHGKTPTQVTLRWIIQQGIIAIPRSGQAAHVSENANIFDFELSPDEIQAINELRGDLRLIAPDSLSPDWDKPAPRLVGKYR